jgi:hypothetical protein
VQRWNLADRWVISNRPAHPALVSEDDFVAAQDINAAREPVPHDHRGGHRLTPGTAADLAMALRWHRPRDPAGTPAAGGHIESGAELEEVR